jgi:hypothetical protein
VQFGAIQGIAVRIAVMLHRIVVTVHQVLLLPTRGDFDWCNAKAQIRKKRSHESRVVC